MNIFLDIETGCQPFDTLPGDRLKAFTETFEKRIGEDYDGDPESAWMDIAPLKAEWGLIVSIAWAVGDDAPKSVRFTDHGQDFAWNEKAGEEEHEMLREIGKELCSISVPVLVSHNGKAFDWPFLCKKFVQRWAKVPRVLRIHDKKPWEIVHQDTLELWAFGNLYNQKASLDSLCFMLGVPTPKGGGIKGPEVPRAFLEGRIQEIDEYCKRDVVALRECFNKLMGALSSS